MDGMAESRGGGASAPVPVPVRRVHIQPTRHAALLPALAAAAAELARASGPDQAGAGALEGTAAEACLERLGGVHRAPAMEGKAPGGSHGMEA